MKKILFATMLGALTLSASAQITKIEDDPILSSIDNKVRPGDDFAKYATGHWLEHNPQPGENPLWGPVYQLSDDNTKKIQKMMLKCANGKHKFGTPAQKIGDLYNLVMDTVRLNEEGTEPLKKYLRLIESLQTREELVEFCHRYHSNIWFGIGLGADAKNASRNIVSIGQSGLSMGLRDYYVNDDEATKKVYEAFRAMAVKLYTYCGYDLTVAMKKVDGVLAQEREMALISKGMVELRDPESNYHKMSIKELSDSTAGFDWDAYLKSYGYDQTTEVDLGQIEPVRLGCQWLMNKPLEQLKDKVVFDWIVSSASALDMRCNLAQFEYTKVTTGVATRTPRWKLATATVNSVMSDVVGQQFIKDYFSPEAKQEVYNMVKNVQAALGSRIRANEWMSDATKEVALDKLNSIYIKVGYPDKWDDLTKLSIDPKLSLFDNILAVQNFYWQFRKNKKYNKPVDKEEWHMSPQTVNAYYNPSTNEICFPAGFLQAPFFDVNGDVAENYGAIGCIMGHEITHGFDDQGRQFDKQGNLKQWWADEDVERFKVPAQRLVDYFNTLWVLKPTAEDTLGLHANGAQCLGENIADLGGINISFDAMHLALAKKPSTTRFGFTPEQRFFMAWAHVWAVNGADAMYRYLTTNDVHSIGFLRVNGPLPHIQAWYDAFDVKANDKLYIAPQNRIKIW